MELTNDKLYILLRIPYNFRWCDWTNTKVGQRRTRSPCPFYFCLSCLCRVKKESGLNKIWNWNDKVYILLRIPYNFRWCDWANRKVGQRRTRSPCPFYFCLSCLCTVKKESGLNKIWNWNDKVYILLRIPYNFRWCDWANTKVGQRRTRSPCPFYFCLPCLCTVKKESRFIQFGNWMTKFTFYCEFHIISGDAIGQIEKWGRRRTRSPCPFYFCLPCLCRVKKNQD